MAALGRTPRERSAPHEEEPHEHDRDTDQCPCGAIQMELAGEAIAQFYCHCDDCQVVHGAHCIPIVMAAMGDVHVTRGTLGVWALKTTPRATCTVCGTRVFADVPNLGARCVSARLFPQAQFKPEFHMQCRFAVLPVKDDLPHFMALPPRFGGSDARVAW